MGALILKHVVLVEIVSKQHVWTIHQRRTSTSPFHDTYRNLRGQAVNIVVFLNTHKLLFSIEKYSYLMVPPWLSEAADAKWVKTVNVAWGTILFEIQLIMLYELIKLTECHQNIHSVTDLNYMIMYRTMLHWNSAKVAYLQKNYRYVLEVLIFALLKLTDQMLTLLTGMTLKKRDFHMCVCVNLYNTALIYCFTDKLLQFFILLQLRFGRKQFSWDFRGDSKP